jgi:hypothetical protein
VVWLRTLMKDAARATQSLVGRQAAQELNGHCPRRSNLHSSTLRVHAVNLCWPSYVGSLKFSPVRNTAQDSRAFFAAMATTAFQ